MEPKYIKAINFDLDINELRKFGMQSKAYSIIGKELSSAGYIHRQYSGYLSLEPLSTDEVVEDIRTILNKHSWLLQCTKAIDATNIIEKIEYDLKSLFETENFKEKPDYYENEYKYYSADSTDEGKTQKEDGYKRLADSINKDKAKERLDKIKNKSKSNSDEHIR